MTDEDVLAGDIDTGDMAGVPDEAHNIYLADVAAALAEMEPEQAAEELRAMLRVRAVGALDRPEFTTAAEALGELPLEVAAGFVAEMSEDRAADVLADIPDGHADGILARLPWPTRRSLRALLAWPKDSAGGMMTTEFVAVSKDASVGEVLDFIRSVERSRETVYSIFLTDAVGALVATISLRRLIFADPASPALDLARGRDPVTVPVNLDREQVAEVIRRHDLLAVPVVDTSKRLLGIVTVDDVLDAIVEENTEDAQKFGAVAATDTAYLDTSFLTMIRSRAGWLSVLFLSEMLTASAMQYFEGELEKAVALTLFIPLIMSSGGNSGSQATSLIIRALALGQVRLADWWRVALRELPAGLILGLILAVVGVIRIAIWQKAGFFDYGEHWALIALTVGCGLIGIVTFGSLAGSMLPFLLQRVGFDPASSSAPFVATLVDVTGLMIYFSIALVILRGTLL